MEEVDIATPLLLTLIATQRNIHVHLLLAISHMALVVFPTWILQPTSHSLIII
jgi:hypothetical protein